MGFLGPDGPLRRHEELHRRGPDLDAAPQALPRGQEEGGGAETRGSVRLVPFMETKTLKVKFGYSLTSVAQTMMMTSANLARLLSE